MAVIILLGIFFYFVTVLMLWSKTMQFPIMVGEQTSENIASLLEEGKIGKDIFFVSQVRRRIVIAELISFDCLYSKKELRENYLKKDRFLTPTEMAAFALRYKDSRKLEKSMSILTSHAANQYEFIEFFQDENDWQIQLADNSNLSNLLHLKRRFGDSLKNKFYIGAAKNPKNLWIRLLCIFCSFIFFVERRTNRKIFR